jgi:hypothetical protein
VAEQVRAIVRIFFVLRVIFNFFDSWVLMFTASTHLPLSAVNSDHLLQGLRDFPNLIIPNPQLPIRGQKANLATNSPRIEEKRCPQGRQRPNRSC